MAEVDADTRNRRLIEQAARDAVKRHRIDPMILPDLCSRLLTHYDARKPEGEQYIVLGVNCESIDTIVAGMRADPQFAERFEHSHEVIDPKDMTDEQYEAQTVAMIDAELRKIAPEGNMLRVTPATKMNIARDIRAKRQQDRPTAQPAVRTSPFRRERQNIATAPMGNTGGQPQGTAVDRLREARRAWHAEGSN
jgi:hypothetical protein